MTMLCMFCGGQVDPRSRFTWHHMEGFERPGRAGGSDVALRQRTGRGVACDPCVRKQQAGLAAGQRSLLEPDPV